MVKGLVKSHTYQVLVKLLIFRIFVCVCVGEGVRGEEDYLFKMFEEVVFQMGRDSAVLASGASFEG